MAARRDRVTFQVGAFDVEVSVQEDVLCVYCGEGFVVAISHAANVLYVRPEPGWSDETKQRIVAHMLRHPKQAGRTVDDLAHNIVQKLKGKR